MILFHDCWSGLGHFELWECRCPANNHQLTMALSMTDLTVMNDKLTYYRQLSSHVCMGLQTYTQDRFIYCEYC